MILLKKILFFFNFSSKIKTILFIASNLVLSLLEIIGLSMLIPILMVLFQTEQVISNKFLNNISLIITENISSTIIIFTIFAIYLIKSF